MWKIWTGLAILIVAVVVAIILYIVIGTGSFSTLDFWLLITAVTFMLASAIVLCGLLMERGFRERQYAN